MAACPGSGLNLTRKSHCHYGKHRHKQTLITDRLGGTHTHSLLTRLGENTHTHTVSDQLPLSQILLQGTITFLHAVTKVHAL